VSLLKWPRVLEQSRTASDFQTNAVSLLTPFKRRCQSVDVRSRIRGHQYLYTRGKILHCDISENNIIVSDDSRLRNKLKGILIDLNLAKR
jgi:RIO-like serine/threonine protein kinase